MKLRPWRAWLVVGVLLVSFRAHAASVETKVRLMVRERPSSSARIVDRVEARKKLPMLGKTPDGIWVHVRSGGKDGWVPAVSVKGAGHDEDSNDESQQADDEPARPLAKRRGVRPEAWVSKSRYHEGEETKLIVSVNKAELFGRPSNQGAVLGILRRGEVVQMVTKSPDKKWINVDIGGGETAWIQARAVAPGKVQTETPPPDESAQQEAAPAPTITPEGAKRKAKFAKAEPPPPPEEQAQPEPPPPVKKSKRQKAVEPPPEEAPPAGRNSEDETPPGLAAGGSDARAASRGDEEPPPSDDTAKGRKKKRKLAKLASRSDDGVAVAAPEATVVKDSWSTRGRLYVTPGVRAGIAILEQRFTSNGMGALTNYTASTNAFGAQVGLGLFGTVGRYLLLGGDASYLFAGGAAIKYIVPADGTVVMMAVQSHTADAGVSAGLHFHVLGGLSLRVRVGGEMVLNLIQPDVRTKLPSDRILGMTIGLGVSAPALFYLGGRALGAEVYGGGMVPAQRAQTLGLEDGAQSTTYGAFFGGGLGIALWGPNLEHYKGQLGLEANYSYNFAATHYTGLSRRNSTITVADRGSAQHLIALGVSFYY